MWGPLAYLPGRVRPPCVQQAGGGNGGGAAVTARDRLDALAAHAADLQIWHSNSNAITICLQIRIQLRTKEGKQRWEDSSAIDKYDMPGACV